MSYLIDTSAVVRMRRDQEIAPYWLDAATAGLVATCPAVEAELVRTARSRADRDHIRDYLQAVFTWQPMPDGMWRDLEQMQDRLVDSAQHRGPSVVDLLVAVTAQAWGLTVLHVDNDFETIARVTGLATQRADNPPAEHR
ncbi:MAG: PIN domain nuclease [Natronosporangium sp.]